MLGYTVVDPSTVLATHISELLKTHVNEIFGRQEVQSLLDKVSEKNPKLVEELVPNLLSLGVVQKVLQNLLKEKVSIRNMVTILETLADFAPATKNIDLLTEYVRQSLSRSITKQYVYEDGTLYLLTLDPKVEDLLTNAIQHAERESFLSLDPGIAQKIIKNIEMKIKKFTETQSHPIVLCSPPVRIHLKRLLERFITNLAILSHSDIDTKTKIKSLGVVNINDAA